MRRDAVQNCGLVSKEAHQFAIGAVGREVLAFGFLLDAHGYSVCHWYAFNGVELDVTGRRSTTRLL